MKLKINGKEEEVNEAALTLARLLEVFKVQDPDMVSVQLNGEFVVRVNFGQTFPKDGDEVDFLYFMGGGQKGGLDR